MLNGLKDTKKVDFKEELLIANAAFTKNDYRTAELHYKDAIHEISAQITGLNKPLGPRLSLLYHKMLLALVKCQIATLHSEEALITIKNYPTLEGSQEQCETLILKARAFLQLGKRTEAIIELEKAVTPLQNHDFQQLATIEAAFWLVPLLIEERKLSFAKQLLSTIDEYLSGFIFEKRATKHFLSTQTEYLCHTSNIFRAEGNISLAIQNLQKSIYLYKQYKKELSTLIDQDIKLNVLSIYAELLLLLNKRAEVTQALDAHQGLIELMDEVIPYASLETKTKVFNAYLIGLKLNYEQGNILIAIEQLNRSLYWLQNSVVPKEIVFKICMVAANFYLQSTSIKSDLSLVFLKIARKNIVSLPEEEQLLATIEILLMQLICEQRLGKTADAVSTFNQLILLKSGINSPTTLGAILEKLLPLFDATENITFQNQISLFKIELRKIQVFIAADMIVNTLSTEAFPQSTNTLSPVIYVPPVLSSYNDEEEEESNPIFVEKIKREDSTRSSGYHRMT